jgi:phosphate transport system protein
MHRQFEKQLKALKNILIEMGGKVENMINEAIQCLVDRKEEGISQVFQDEEIVNQRHIEIDEKVITLLALQHPVATDLRLCVMASKIASELERMGDQAINICDSTKTLLEYPPLKPLIDLPRMAEITRGMVRESLQAFIQKDVTMAQNVLKTDDEVDGLKDQIFREILTYIMSDPETIPRAIPLIFISRNLERIADHATNIAEEVIYFVQGREVRHHIEENR